MTTDRYFQTNKLNDAPAASVEVLTEYFKLDFSCPHLYSLSLPEFISDESYRKKRCDGRAAAVLLLRCVRSGVSSTL